MVPEKWFCDQIYLGNCESTAFHFQRLWTHITILQSLRCAFRKKSVDLVYPSISLIFRVWLEMGNIALTPPPASSTYPNLLLFLLSLSSSRHCHHRCRMLSVILVKHHTENCIHSFCITEVYNFRQSVQTSTHLQNTQTAAKAWSQDMAWF